MVAFSCYDPSTDGTGGIHKWYLQEISQRIRSEIDSALELLCVEAKLDGHPHFKELVLGTLCQGLAEIKIDFPDPTGGNLVSPKKLKKSKKRQKPPEINIRILGPHNPPTTNFILLSGFIKVGNHQYGTMCPQAQRRKERVEKDATRAKPCRFP